jgi:hypothetical protein
MKKKILSISMLTLIGLGLTVSSTSCGTKEGCTNPQAKNYDSEAEKDNGTCDLSGNQLNGNVWTINEDIKSGQDITWTKDKVYILNKRIVVEDGGKLRIQAGTIIKGQVGSGANASCLIIARGGQIFAEGTAAEPIIFTSIADAILPKTDGDAVKVIASPNLASNINGLWGGLIVLGRAPISADAEAVQIDGIPTSDLRGLYGGTNATDNSGVLKYISIRHGGALIGNSNEINGLTLGGVGSGTIVENIEIVSNQDDGVEFFGGTVNAKNIIVWNSGDDAIDTDQAWAGTLDNFIVICGDNTDHAIEVDGPEGSLLASHTIKNGSVKGSSSAEMADYRSSARATTENVYFFNFPSPKDPAGRGDLSLKSTNDQTSLVTFNDGFLTFSNLQVTLVEGLVISDVFKDGTKDFASLVTLKNNTVGADKSAFASWTWADAAGQLADFDKKTGL